MRQMALIHSSPRVYVGIGYLRYNIDPGRQLFKGYFEK